jgi:cyclic pyranopterin phosphate synthase
MAGVSTRVRAGGVQDGHGRRIEYLRLSVTDRCNLRCVYCLPDGCTAPGAEVPLTVAEIERLVRGFAELGIWKVRLTGGEPALRGDLAEIIRTVAAVPGVRRVGISTNGLRLAETAADLRAAGLDGVNVSVDSLDGARFERITGAPLLGRVTAGVEAALAAGIPKVKVNAVLLGGADPTDVEAFLAWTRERPVSVRFIELMETRDNREFFRRHHVPADAVARTLEARGWRRVEREREGGPATVYAHPDHRGSVGLIAPYARGFCETCNRVRVTAAGALRSCLFGRAEVPLRDLLQSDASWTELVALLAASIWAKPAAHHLREGDAGTARTLAATGG